MRTPTSKNGKSFKISTKNLSSRNSQNCPISIDDIFCTAKVNDCNKNNRRVRKYSIWMEPTNDKSPIIKKIYYPLDIPSTIYKVLQTQEKIQEGIKGNNITSGANMYMYYE